MAGPIPTPVIDLHSAAKTSEDAISAISAKLPRQVIFVAATFSRPTTSFGFSLVGTVDFPADVARKIEWRRRIFHHPERGVWVLEKYCTSVCDGDGTVPLVSATAGALIRRDDSLVAPAIPDPVRERVRIRIATFSDNDSHMLMLNSADVRRILKEELHKL